MASNPFELMTVEQITAQIAKQKDIIAMLNSGATNQQIAAKYGYYPASHDEAVKGLNALETELKKKNGTWVPSTTQPFNPNCGVVGCWGTDEYGNKKLNGKIFAPANTALTLKQKAEGLPMVAKVLLCAAALIAVYYALKGE